LEKFNVQLAPIPIPELTNEIKRVIKEENENIKRTLDFVKEHTKVCISNAQLETIGALKLAMQNLATKYNCNAAAIQCWNALQDELGIMPCAANSMLTDEGLPVVCETDIHGAISSLMISAATMNTTPPLFCDWTVRHPTNENAELLQHCGSWPISLATDKPEVGVPLAFNHPGSLAAVYPNGNLTIARFDGDNGEYSMLLGTAKAVPAPYTKGPYLWVEVADLDRLEEKIVTGPYVHHCSAVYGNVVPVLYEACKYIGIKADLFDPIEEEVMAIIRGSIT
jgi:L-fucose isomerase-like protein